MRFVLGLLLSLLCVHAQPDPIHICDFTSGTCGWINDLNSWNHRWEVVQFRNASTDNAVLCLPSKMDSNIRSQSFRSPWSKSPISVVDESSSETTVIQSRLWSPPIRKMDKLGCLMFSYLLHLGNTNAQRKVAANIQLALLRRQERSCRQSKDPETHEIGLFCGNKPIWQSADQLHRPRHDSGQWAVAVIDLSAGDIDYKLILEGTIPAGYPDARICVDNITSYTEPCSALQKVSKTVTTQWTWAQYFSITFVTALILGLTIPVVFLVILIWACRRRHHSTHSSYTNNKLFSTNLWYYIGGKELCDDSNGYRGSTSLLRGHNKTFNGSGTGTTGTMYASQMGGTTGSEVMDLPDVVIPGGRVVSFNYSGNTLGPGGTMRHMQHSMTTASSVQPMHGFVTMGPQTMTTGMGTVSSQSSGTTNVTGMRPIGTTDGVPHTENPITVQPTIDYSTAGQIQQQQQQQQQLQQQQPFRHQQQPQLQMQPLQQQAPMIMSQSVLPNTCPSDQMMIPANNDQFNTCVPTSVTVPQPMQYSVQTQPVQQQQQQLQQQQQQQQGFFQPPQQQQQPQPVMIPAQSNNVIGQFQPTQQPAAVPPFTGAIPAPAVQQPMTQPQMIQAQQMQPCQTAIQQQQQQQATQLQPQPPPQPIPNQQQINFAQSVNCVPAAPSIANPVLGGQQMPQNPHAIVQSAQLPPQQQQQHHAFANQQQARVQPRPLPQSNIQAVQPQPQQTHQPITCTNNSAPTSNQSAQPFQANSPTGQQLIAAVTPTTRAQVSSTPINSVQSDSLTEADQQAAMAALYAATEDVDCANNNGDNYATANGANDLDATYTIPGEINEDHPPPGYDEAIGLVLSRGQINGNNHSHANSAAVAAGANYLQANTMVKPAVPVPSTTCTPPPALPPRRLINGLGLEDVDDSQPSACLSLAERYGLPVAEI